MWQADTSKVVGPACVGEGLMGYPPRASVEHAGDMGPVSLVAYRQQVFDLSALVQWLCWERN
jgi:hypothetical protein